MNKVKRNITVKAPARSNLERHPVPVLGINYKVKIEYKNIKIAELDVENKTIKISLPNKYKKTSNTKILDLAIEKMYEQIAKVEIERAMEKARIELGFAPEDYIIKRLENNQMATCLTDEKKIIINPDIVKLDKKAIEYALLHEFCHLKYKIHAKGFWKMIKTYMPDYEKYKNLAV